MKSAECVFRIPDLEIVRVKLKNAVSLNVEIPHSQLSYEALRAIIEEFISREGADYGPIEYSLEEKVGHVMQQLDRGEVVVNFDAASETCNLISTR